MKNSKKVFSILCFLISISYLFGQEVKFEPTETFFPNWESLKKEKIKWGHLEVPENWDNPEGKRIKMAVAVLENVNNIENPQTTVFIQGGPGASGIEAIDLWLYQRVRRESNVVLLDVRGTGFSEPRMCPDLGKVMMKILAKDQAEALDEADKTAAALACQKELVQKGIDINAYHSLSVAKDLHALKNYLQLEEWNVYGVSYGTYMAQVYASTFPADIRSIILDSSVAGITDYLTNNASNFMYSLSKVFSKCENDPDCNADYPNLESVFFETIQLLETNPVSVKVSKRFSDTDSFTYNAEDFKVALQQALYHKQLVEIIPLLIYQFHDRNEAALGNLVSAFSSMLGLDYGQYYCVSCNEVVPNNEIEKFNAKAAAYEKLSGGISFYKSDFSVCDKWNMNTPDSLLLRHDLSGLKELNTPVMIFAGEYDPITPSTNGQEIAQQFSNAFVLEADTYGHAPGFTRIGELQVEAFIKDPTQKPNLQAFEKAPLLSFANGIKLNGGVSHMGRSLDILSPFFMVPLLMAILLAFAFIGVYLFKLFKGKYKLASDKIVRGLSVLTSITGLGVLIGFILALLNVTSQNYYILAFGLPDNYNYLFIGLFIFAGLVLVSLLYFLLKIKKINDKSIVFSVIFSNMVFAIYFMYWGVL